MTNLGVLFKVDGNFTLQSTGSGVLRLAAGTTSILGNYSQTGGIIRLAGASARTLTVGGSFSFTAGTFRISDGAAVGILNVAGNYSHTGGTMTKTSSGSGNIVFNGSSNQSYTGGGTISNIVNYTVNNPSGITSLTSVTFPAALTMTQGNIVLNNNALTLGTGSTTATKGILSWTSGFMTGAGTFTRWFDNTTEITIGTNAGLFPMGNITDNRNVWIGGTLTTGGTVSVQHTNTAGTTAISFTENSQTFNKRTNMSWTLSNANGFAGSSLSLRIRGSGIPGINAVGDLNICLSAGAAGGNYSAPGGTTTDPQVNRIGLSQTTLANTYYFAATSGSPLTVELSSFFAVVLENGVRLEWRTETEVNNYGFEIERERLEVRGEKWEKIGFVESYGNSNSPKDYSFIDDLTLNHTVTPTFRYRLKQIDNDGNIEYSKVIEVNLGSPGKFELSQNYPNPFNPVTTIRYSLPEAGNIKLSVYNLLGEEVAKLVSGFKETGVHKINFNAKSFNSGVYICKLESGHPVYSIKMVLLK